MKKELKKYEAIIFDLDGTLINSIPYHSKAFFEIAILHGSMISQSEVDSLMGTPSHKIFEYLKKKYHLVGDIPELRKERRKIFKKIIHGKNLLFPGVMSMLSSVKKNFKIGIATGSSLITMKRSTNSEFRKKFKFISTIDDVKKGKPSPDQLFLVAKKLKISPKNCLVVGDSVFDAIAARRTRMGFIGVRTGFKKGKPLEKHKHLAIVSSVRDLSHFFQ
ncbi:HAD family phosphatase [Candidatus Pacearchaeota archaeon]|nr:HAD family phosphatase [Candidatus Pacearchaeota archaeon]